jgi:phage recombination protein Bet
MTIRTEVVMQEGASVVPAQKPSLIQKFAARMGVEAGKMMTTLKQTCFRLPATKSGELQEVSNEEMMALLIVADQYNLNPFTKEIYAFPDRKRGGIVPIVGVDGWNRIINEHPQFNGVSFETGLTKDGKLDWIECTLHRKDRIIPTTIREYLRENRRDTDLWGTMPNRMLRHRALIQCARIAFGFVGIYDQDEGERIIEGTLTSSPSPVEDLNNEIASKPRVVTEEIVDTVAVNATAETETKTDAPITFAEITARVLAAEKNKDGDALDLAADAARGLADPQQRAEVDVEVRRIRATLA